jgi:hypothetical protein
MYLPINIDTQCHNFTNTCNSKTVIFWNIKSCSLANDKWNVSEESSRLKMEAQHLSVNGDHLHNYMVLCARQQE